MSWFSGYNGKKPGENNGSGTRPSRNLPQPNYVELSEEEDLEEGLVFDSPLTSPGRPHQSASVSPKVLLQPDPPTTEELLTGVNKKITNLPEEVVVKEEIVVEDLVVGDPTTSEVEVENQIADMPDAIVPFETENGEDEAGALREACRSLDKLEWDDTNLPWFFNRMETRMSVAGVKKNFTKFQVLSEVIPKRVQDEVMQLLMMTETEFPNHDAYKQLKTEIFRIFGPRLEAGMERALGRVLTGKPSQLARALVNDMCKSKLNCQCCPANVGAMWKRQLSSAVRAGIAHTEFNKDNFNAVVQLADDIHSNTSSTPSVASVSGHPASNLDQTLPAIPYATTPEVAAINRGRGRGRNRGRGGPNRGRGGHQQQQQTQQQQQGANRHKGTKHPDLPAGEWSGCQMHFKWGKGAHFCSEPGSCPWRNVFTPKNK